MTYQLVIKIKFETNYVLKGTDYSHGIILPIYIVVNVCYASETCTFLI